MYFYIPETVLGPVWVWLGGYEAPPLFAVYGGIMLIVALGTHSIVALRDEAAAARAQQEELPITDIELTANGEDGNDPNESTYTIHSIKNSTSDSNLLGNQEVRSVDITVA